MLAIGNSNAKNLYKPAKGDKFQYKILLTGGKRFPATFIYDVKDDVPSFHWKWGNENPIWGNWNQSKISSFNIANDLTDSSILTNSNLLYLNPILFSKIKSRKNFVLTIKGENYEFKCGETSVYNLPINGAEIKFKLLSATSKNKKWIISVLDNEPFPLIIGLIGDISWQLQSIFPVSLYPITQNLTGNRLDSKQANMFENYTKETCEMIEVSYTDNYKKVVYSEFFCPIVGIRFSLKNDTIVALQLVTDKYQSDGYHWQTYYGYVWGIYRLGDKQTTIESDYGKPIKSLNGKNYYPYKKFYLIYNTNGELERVEYE